MPISGFRSQDSDVRKILESRRNCRALEPISTLSAAELLRRSVILRNKIESSEQSYAAPSAAPGIVLAAPAKTVDLLLTECPPPLEDLRSADDL